MRNALVLASFVLIAGCGGGHPVDRAISNANILVDLICEDCYGTTGATSSAACYEMFGMLTPPDSQVQCIRDLADRDPAVEAYYECFNEVTYDTLVCVDAANDMCDEEELGECYQQLPPGIERCNDEHLTAAGLEALQECID